jgi:SAM-dependent methyltransferase
MNLEAAGAHGDVYCRDFADLGTELEHGFDIGVSFGVVEHFEDTASIVGTFARCIKPGGLLMTSVPNLTGGMGRIVARMDRDVFAGHKPVSAEDLAAAHRACGLRPICVTYLALLSPGMLNWTAWPGQRWLEIASAAGDSLLLHGRRLTGWRGQSPSWSAFALVIAKRPV